jgi:hypothetical protein
MNLRSIQKTIQVLLSGAKMSSTDVQSILHGLTVWLKTTTKTFVLAGGLIISDLLPAVQDPSWGYECTSLRR